MLRRFSSGATNNKGGWFQSLPFRDVKKLYATTSALFCASPRTHFASVQVCFGNTILGVLGGPCFYSLHNSTVAGENSDSAEPGRDHNQTNPAIFHATTASRGLPCRRDYESLHR
ncbi:hypothetical protein BO85DRAFT_508341 [Aspergillus piperis CBS 112811]|uniref:Uncharacterized protein n=1 Tax=Aspergillus piperis CBS 112811 TaxID=1448313 RepID=A0A8G1QTK8_9EURO|nr:hypothetical protein BO85DRAFT_508341 [Aspergillus piperis CBS 112811]RAH52020.1 hypothetical protein BO85DRAFT_508341 [Aspergillus piperis CBS 112811]